MKLNKKIIVIFTMLLSYFLLLGIETTVNAVSLSVEETNYRGAVIKISNSKKISSLKIYQKDNNGNWVKFFEDNDVNDTEKSYFISKYRLSTTDASKLKVIAVSEDGTEDTTEKDVQKLPDAPDPIPVPSDSPNSNPVLPDKPNKPNKPNTPSNPGDNPAQPSTPGNDGVTSISINSRLTLYTGGSKQLTLTLKPSNAKTTLKWSTSNANVAKVDSKGKVSAKGKGNATITVTTSNGKTATCQVTVKPTNTTLNKHKVTLKHGNDKVYFLDVSDMHKYKDGSKKVQGSDAIILESNGKYAMIDVGVDYQGKRVSQYLKDIGIDELEWILITHAHGDHYGGLEKVLNTVTVKSVYVKDITAGKSGRKGNYKKRIVNVIKNNKKNKNITKIYDVKDKRYRNIAVGEMQISLYNAATDHLKKKDSTKGENVNSVTALAKINGKKLYFGADIVNDTNIKVNAENTAAKAVNNVDFYKVAHHSYSPNNAAKALEYLRPKECVVTNTSPGNKPSTKDANTRIKRYTSKFQYTASGTVILTIAEDGKLLYNKLGEDK